MKPDLKSLFPNASKAFIAANPHLYHLDAIPAKVAKPIVAPALDRRDAKLKEGKDGVAVRVAIVALRKRLCDKDGNIGSFKPVQDAIADSLGIDDGDPRISWEYGQQQTNGQEGLIVKIEFT